MNQRTIRPTLPYRIPYERRVARESWGASGSAFYRNGFPLLRRLDPPRVDRVGVWLARFGSQLLLALLAVLLGIFIGLGLGTPS